MPNDRTPAVNDATPFGGCLLRLVWLGLGNLFLFIFAALISKTPSWTFTLLDLGFWAVVGMLVLARYFDITRYGGATAEGAPATLKHFGKYSVGLLAVSVGVWLTVQSLHI